jgi:hypothetical protein
MNRSHLGDAGRSHETVCHGLRRNRTVFRHVSSFGFDLVYTRLCAMRRQ